MILSLDGGSRLESVDNCCKVGIQLGIGNFRLGEVAENILRK